MKKIILLLILPFIVMFCPVYTSKHTARHLYWTDFNAFEKTHAVGVTFSWVSALVIYTLIAVLISEYVGGL